MESKDTAGMFRELLDGKLYSERKLIWGYIREKVGEYTGLEYPPSYPDVNSLMFSHVPDNVLQSWITEINDYFEKTYEDNLRRYQEQNQGAE